MSRRQGKTQDQKKAEKAEYDKKYRVEHEVRIKRRKAKHFSETYDPEKARIDRKRRMPKHVQYCRRPEYRRYKRAYDIKYLAKRNYGEFGEAFILLRRIDKEVGKRMTGYDIRMQQGTINKAQKRKRNAYYEIPNRHRPNRNESQGCSLGHA